YIAKVKRDVVSQRQHLRITFVYSISPIRVILHLSNNHRKREPFLNVLSLQIIGFLISVHHKLLCSLYTLPLHPIIESELVIIQYQLKDI
ncbi:MAG: hypothetical protein ACLU9T_20605, partial [Blautia faecis]